jgi:hypothetical protein
LSDVQVVYAGELNDIGIDAEVHRLAARAHCLQGLGTDAVPKYSLAEVAAGVVIDQFGVGFHLGIAFEEHWSRLTVPKIRKAGTGHIYGGAIAHMRTERGVCIRDVVGSGLCISSYSGQKVFDTLRSAISQGNKICLSFENIKSLSTAFIDSALGQLYSGGIIQGDIDEKISFENISPGRKLMVDEAIREAREYYSDPARYVTRMKEIFADD